MQRDGIRLQQAGKKIGRDRHPARRDDDRADIIQRQPPRRGSFTKNYFDFSKNQFAVLNNKLHRNFRIVDVFAS
jgi:hypothetical protein